MALARASHPARGRKQITLSRTLFKRTAPATSAASNPTRATAGVSAASDRVLTDVILAIQPTHLGNIVSRQKNHEYRKYRLRDGVERLWFYESKGARHGERKGRAAITHIATIPPDIRRTPGTVPEEPFGIGNAEFNAGLKQSKYGYPTMELFELSQPVTLDEMKNRWQIGGAPMGWLYLKQALWDNGWGEEESRGDRMKRIF